MIAGWNGKWIVLESSDEQLVLKIYIPYERKSQQVLISTKMSEGVSFKGKMFASNRRVCNDNLVYMHKFMKGYFSTNLSKRLRTQVIFIYTDKM